MSERDLDVVVLGATGITGRLAAAYLARHRPEARWAAAARDADRAERLLGELGASPPQALPADVGDRRSLDRLASRSRVIVNFVGPYTLHATPVIEACIESGTHYVDLSGEIPFVRRIIDAYGARAEDAGVKVVQLCGFEALPPDALVLLAAERGRDRHGEGPAEVDLEWWAKAPSAVPRPSELLSGGTLQSLAEIVGGKDAAAVTDPAALIEDEAVAVEVRRRSPIAIAPRRGPRASIVAPMTPTPYINPAVIHRTAALGAAEGGASTTPFRYREGVALGGGPATLPLRYAVSGALWATQAGLGALVGAPPAIRDRLAAGLRRLLPSSGFGPAGERLEDWRWGMDATARTAAGEESVARLEGEGQPFYLATARAVAEAGLMLAEPGLTPERAGCLTPATALGTAALDRFEQAGLRFR